MPAPALDYEFFAPPHVTFGWGRRTEAGRLAARLGRRAFLVGGSRTLLQNGAGEEIRQSLAASQIEVIPLTTSTREPEVADVDHAVEEMRSYEPAAGDFVLALGGGSAMDLAKAVAALATNRQGRSVQDFLEGVGQGLQIEHDPLPVMAMPTTAGTGSEATKNAVISSFDPPFKKSLRSVRLVPQVVLVDPELTVSVPPKTTAYTGMDAITQLIESFLSRKAKPIPQSLCLAGLSGAIPALATAVEDGENRPAREIMSQAALLSGLALANSGLGLAHGVAAALGVHCGVPHGLACAVMLPVALRANVEVSRDRLPDLAAALTGSPINDPDEAARVCIETIDALAKRIGIPNRLSALGVTAEQIPALVQGSRGNSLDGNPREISPEELQLILEACL